MSSDWACGLPNSIFEIIAQFCSLPNLLHTIPAVHRNWDRVLHSSLLVWQSVKLVVRNKKSLADLFNCKPRCLKLISHVTTGTGESVVTNSDLTSIRYLYELFSFGRIRCISGTFGVQQLAEGPFLPYLTEIELGKEQLSNLNNMNQVLQRYSGQLTKLVVNLDDELIFDPPVKFPKLKRFELKWSYYFHYEGQPIVALHLDAPNLDELIVHKCSQWVPFGKLWKFLVNSKPSKRLVFRKPRAIALKQISPVLIKERFQLPADCCIQIDVELDELVGINPSAIKHALSLTKATVQMNCRGSLGTISYLFQNPSVEPLSKFPLMNRLILDTYLRFVRDPFEKYRECYSKFHQVFPNLNCIRHVVHCDGDWFDAEKFAVRICDLAPTRVKNVEIEIVDSDFQYDAKKMQAQITNRTVYCTSTRNHKLYSFINRRSCYCFCSRTKASEQSVS